MASGIPLTAAPTSPPPSLAVLRPFYFATSYVSYSDDQSPSTAVIAEGVYNPRAKIAVETAQKAESGKTFVNLRFCYSNRYIGRSEGSSIPIAELTQPNEDTTQTSSTLFELTNAYDNPWSYNFCHVQSGNYVMLNEMYNTLAFDFWPGEHIPDCYCFQLVDWQSLVKLPQHVAFKGSNGSYLRGYTFKGLPYLQFSADDPNNEEAGHEVVQMSDGYVKIKSLLFSGNYWRNADCWIWADSQDTSTTDQSLLFWPEKVDDTTIALRSVMNNNFCTCLTADDATNCLDAHSPTITSDAHLVVQELVSGRIISNVVYRMEDARIFGEKPYSAGSTTAVNDTDADASINVTLSYTVTQTYSFSNSTSLTAGVTATIEASLLDIVNESIQFSTQISESFESGQTTSTDITNAATGIVDVPAKSSRVVYYVGTMGTCNVPFKYTQQDTSSTTGEIIYTDMDDGIYTGVNYYNFSFKFDNVP